jgi:hypothetical protein
MGAWRSGDIKSCKTNPICPQLAKRGGALRVCAMRRAARAETKIGRVPNFFAQRDSLPDQSSQRKGKRSKRTHSRRASS